MNISCIGVEEGDGLTYSLVQLDVDRLTQDELVEMVRQRWPFLLRFTWPKFGKLRIKSLNVRKTRHGWHIRIYVKNKVQGVALAFLQQAFGSDFRRECYNFRRIMEIKQMKSWDLLYAWKFNGQDQIISYESPDPVLSRQLLKLARQFRSHKK